MAYSTTVTALDLSSGVPDVRVSAGYTWTEVGGPRSVERVQEQVGQDIASLDFQSTAGTVFGYAGDLAPQPSPAWFIALWVQEIPRIANGTGWLFRSGRMTTEPPALPVDIVLAPEQLIGAAELSSAIGTLPLVSRTTTITGLTLTVIGADIALVAVGTDTGLRVGVTFRYSATLGLIPNGSLDDLDSPFNVSLTNAGLAFMAGVGTGFVTALLNAVSGVILGDISPRLKSTIKGRLNSGVLTSVGTTLNRGVPATLPAGVVLSIRSVRATTRPLGGSTEPVIGVKAALGSFGGVLSKFPPAAASTGGGYSCPFSAAMARPDAPELQVIRRWRDQWLRRRQGGGVLIATYRRLAPSMSRRIEGSQRGRAATRALVVLPTARLAAWLLADGSTARGGTDMALGDRE